MVLLNWINTNRSLVKDFIESEGGYRLLLNEASTVDLIDESYDEEVFDGTEVLMSLQRMMVKNNV